MAIESKLIMKNGVPYVATLEVTQLDNIFEGMFDEFAIINDALNGAIATSHENGRKIVNYIESVNESVILTEGEKFDKVKALADKAKNGPFKKVWTFFETIFKTAIRVASKIANAAKAKAAAIADKLQSKDYTIYRSDQLYGDHLKCFDKAYENYQEARKTSKAVMVPDLPKLDSYKDSRTMTPKQVISYVTAEETFIKKMRDRMNKKINPVFSIEKQNAADTESKDAYLAKKINDYAECLMAILRNFNQCVQKMLQNTADMVKSLGKKGEKLMNNGNDGNN